MSRQANPADPSQQVSSASRIDRVCLEFEDAWQAGHSPRIEDFVDRLPLAEQGLLLKELLLLELTYLRQRGQQPQADEYLTRFPNHPTIVAEVMGVRPAIEYVEWRVGQRIGRYTLEQRIAQGSFGQVFLAWDTELERLVALKSPRSNAAVALDDFNHLVEEARTVAKIEHPAIVPVLDIFRDDRGIPVMVMPYIEGQSLEEYLHNDTLELNEAIPLLIQIAAATDFAHRRGFVHRDLKPCNIILDPAGNPLITDFGLAIHESTQHTRAGESAGSLAYMSPEQLRGESHWLDGRSDIWALGVMMYQMLCGRRPFNGQTHDELASEIFIRDPKPLRQINADIPVALEQICLTCLCKSVAGRYATAGDFADALRLAGHQLGLADMSDAGTATEPRQSSASARTKPSNLHIMLLGIAAVAALLFAGMTVAARRQRTEHSTASALAIDIELSVWSAKDEFAGRINRRESSPTPLRTGDKIRLAVTLNRPAYLYVLWIGTDGDLTPLYPWSPGDWQLPARLTATNTLQLPGEVDQTWPVTAGAGGIETVVVIAADSPLPAQLDVSHAASKLHPQTGLILSQPLWFANGQLLPTTPATMRSVDVSRPTRLASPIVVNQSIIMKAFGQHVSSVHALCVPLSGD